MEIKTVTGKTLRIDKFSNWRYTISILTNEGRYQHLAFMDENVIDLFIQCFKE